MKKIITGGTATWNMIGYWYTINEDHYETQRKFIERWGILNRFNFYFCGNYYLPIKN